MLLYGGYKSQVHIYLFDSGYHSLLVCYGMLYVREGDSQQWVHTSTRIISPRAFISAALS